MHGDAALIGFNQTVEHLEQGGFPGPIFADQSQAISPPPFKRNPLISSELIFAEAGTAAIHAHQVNPDILHTIHQGFFQGPAEFFADVFGADQDFAGLAVGC